MIFILTLIMNMSDDIMTIELPMMSGKKWCLALNTSQLSPNDIIEPKDQQPYNEATYTAHQKSVIIFESRTV